MFLYEEISCFGGIHYLTRAFTRSKWFQLLVQILVLPVVDDVWHKQYRMCSNGETRTVYPPSNFKEVRIFYWFQIEAFYLSHEMVKTLGFSNAKLYIILQQILHWISKNISLLKFSEVVKNTSDTFQIKSYCISVHQNV